MRITNKAGLPDAIVWAVLNDRYDAGESHITVTRLIDAPQVRILARRHWEELEEDVADRIWALLGQVVHGILERAETIALTEERLFANIESWRVSGQFDRLVLFPDGTLQDYKLTSVWSVINGGKIEWERQLNCLRLLAHVNGYQVERLQIIAILRDWSKGKARRGENYPAIQVQVLDVPVWSLDEAERYMHERVRLHQQAEQGQVPECTAEERWEQPTTYAVRRKGRKTAIRVLENQAEAEAMAEEAGGYVGVRPGRSVRCEEYCPVSRFCPQFARGKAH
jgi:hypothetical protein